MATLHANKGTIYGVIRADTPGLLTNKAILYSIVNFPTERMDANQALVLPVYRATNDMHVNKATTLVVCKGRLASPNVLMWTAVLDDHEFLFIQLQTETLVYDFASKQWSTWGSGNYSRFPAQRGQNWNANLGFLMGDLGGPQISNIVCGDDTTGALYFLDPSMSVDDSSAGDREIPFRRAITGQLLARGRDKVRLNRVEVVSSSGSPVSSDNLTVTLEYSDDKGISYRSAGDRSVILGDYDTVLEWRSLGSYDTPGRLVRLVDWGALTRVDDWTAE